VRGNTVNLTDPSGRFVFLAALAAIAIVAAVGTILGGIGGFAVDIYNQLNNNGGNWNCLDVGQAAQRGLNNALFGGGVGLTVGVAGVGAYSLLSPWLIPAAGTLGAQDPKKVEAAIEVGHDVVDWVGETLAAGDASVSHALIDSSASPIQDALPNVVESTVITETFSKLGQGDITSQYTVDGLEMFDIAEEFLGPDYVEKQTDVFYSADNTRRFRMDVNSLAGTHRPWVPHFHLEIGEFNGRTWESITNNHIPIIPR